MLRVRQPAHVGRVEDAADAQLADSDVAVPLGYMEIFSGPKWQFCRNWMIFPTTSTCVAFGHPLSPASAARSYQARASSSCMIPPKQTRQHVVMVPVPPVMKAWRQDRTARRAASSLRGVRGSGDQ